MHRELGAEALAIAGEAQRVLADSDQAMPPQATLRPALPVHTLAIDPANRNRLFVGTDLGVFVSLDAGPHWAVENTGFANVITEQLKVAPGDAVTPPQLFAFTYGRGASHFHNVRARREPDGIKIEPLKFYLALLARSPLR